ncbi:Ber1p [Sporobolomyces salmoneus]|uniref:Ber1p n=1 Tax=Sporobolomyces salmoneus TaxID=183962 RepID=UPI00316B8CCD
MSTPAVQATLDDGFTSVTYKKKPAKKNRKGKNRYIERTLSEKLSSREENLRQSGYLGKCRELLRNCLHPTTGNDDDDPSTSACPAPKRVVCLGLGSVSDSTKAQDQYILSKELLLELNGIIDPEEPVKFYDPVFTPEDTSFLLSEGHSVLSSSFELSLRLPTLLYIPHGPRSLFNDLISENWTRAQLEKMIIFGNRLDLYEDPTYSGTTSQSGEGEEGELKEGMESIRKAAKLFEIVPLPTTKEHLEAFNDLAIEWVDPKKVEEAVKDGRIPETMSFNGEKQAKGSTKNGGKTE